MVVLKQSIRRPPPHRLHDGPFVLAGKKLLIVVLKIFSSVSPLSFSLSWVCLYRWYMLLPKKWVCGTEVVVRAPTVG